MSRRNACCVAANSASITRVYSAFWTSSGALIGRFSEALAILSKKDEVTGPPDVITLLRSKGGCESGPWQTPDLRIIAIAGMGGAAHAAAALLRAAKLSTG